VTGTKFGIIYGGEETRVDIDGVSFRNAAGSGNGHAVYSPPVRRNITV